ncbi:TRIO and F-actin-binding protein [Nibea albiflora]|uniref:TRIO and F-actin-binding protein n=1 Tax=Nibea albiflora TaxID=240163 RepID=A0ACB7FLG6_NIBAL|nr:TRIO and F-actin-binding protein [Nibea albiflora]
MDERRDRSRRASGSVQYSHQCPMHQSRGDRQQESGYFSPKRRGDGEQQTEEVNKPRYRYYERGHPLPSNYVLEPKACVPYRNVNLGVPSQRRNPETYMLETWRSESPESEGAPSPGVRLGLTPHLITPLSFHHMVLHGIHPAGPVRPADGGPIHLGRSHPLGPHLLTGAQTLYIYRTVITMLKRQAVESRGAHRKLQTNTAWTLRSSTGIWSLSPAADLRPSSRSLMKGSRTSSRSRTAVNSSAHTRSRNSREVSPPRNGYSTQSHTPQREPCSRDSRLSPSQGSWQGSSHSLLSLPPSRGSSSSRRGADTQVLGGSPSHVAVTETDKGNEENNTVGGDRSRSNVRRGMEALLISEPKKAPVEVEEVSMTIDDYIVLADIPTIHLESEEENPGLRRRNQSPSPCRDQKLRTYRYQDEPDVHSSRLESDERGRGRERGRDRREKCRESENGRSSRRQSATSVHTQVRCDNSRRVHGETCSEAAELIILYPVRVQIIKVENTDLQRRRSARRRRCCYFSKGWMSRLDEHGKWRKHWFVLGDTSLRFYRDSEAEESDDLDGEINLTSCVNVSDCDVEKNYGLQIQTKRAVFTLSAMTSRIRRNWVKLLKQAIQNNTHQSDTGSEKENPLSRRPSSCQPPARFTCRDSGSEPTTSTSAGTAAKSHRAADHNHDQVSADGDLDGDLSPASQREEGEGWDREQAKRLEERNKWFEEGVPFSEMGSRWDSMELKRGNVPIPVIETLDSEVSRKWAELETLSFSGMTAQSLIGAQAYQSNTPQTLVSSQTYQSSPEEVEQSETDMSSSKGALPSMNGAQNIQTNTAEALQKEALSLRKQVESIKRERAAMGIEVDSPCGPGAPCRARLEAMEVAHRKALQELQEKHAREVRELEERRDRMLKDESQTAAKAMEALRAAHREELQREVEKARRSAGGAAHVDTASRGHMLQADVFHSELDVLSERYSEKCLQLSLTEQSTKGRETELGHKERELEQLRRENQELKAKLAEEISRMRYFITGQRSDVVSPGNAERSASEVETLLRAKDNEVQYLKKEISCLQNEVQALTKEKDAAIERYKEAYVELSDTRGRSQLEMGSLNEHLRLANAALQEGARQT